MIKKKLLYHLKKTQFFMQRLFLCKTNKKTEFHLICKSVSWNKRGC